MAQWLWRTWYIGSKPVISYFVNSYWKDENKEKLDLELPILKNLTDQEAIGVAASASGQLTCLIPLLLSLNLAG